MPCNGDCNQGRECNCKCKMTDREEFEKFLSTDKAILMVAMIKTGDRFERDIAKLAWQARGELDAVKIKELELANKILIGMTDNMANQISEYEVIDKGQLERIKELEADLDDRKREVNLRCGQIQERDIRIAELTAKNKELEELIKRAMIPTQEAMQQSQGNPVFLRQGSKLVAGHSGVFVEETK